MKRIITTSLVVVILLSGCGVETASEVTQSSEPTETTEVIIPMETDIIPIETTEEVEVTEPQYNIVINKKEATALAKMAWGEARGCSDMEIAATMWCVLNRADNRNQSIIKVITAPGQFHGYKKGHPVTDRIYNLAVDVLTRWQMEKQGASPEEVGRVLPPEYEFFHGKGGKNHFRNQYKHKGATYWDWSYPNPYETEVS